MLRPYKQTHLMTYIAKKHHRRSIRLQGYDYSQPGMYFVTVCTEERELLFGEVVKEAMVENEYGEVARTCWEEIPHHFQRAELDVFVVMPNHVHGILIIADKIRTSPTSVGAQHAAPLSWRASRPNVSPGSLGAIIRSFKSATTKRINNLRATPYVPPWQRGYYEHVIRNEDDLRRIREYILTNPLRWELDRENPARQGEDEFDRWLASLSPKRGWVKK
jgi:putative transposase